MNQQSYRRRRKRTRPQKVTDSTKQQKLPSFDDSSLAFLDSDGDALLDRKAIWSCLPKLLEERRVGKWDRKQRKFQSKALSTFAKKPDDDSCRRQWRPLAQRAIPFTHLGTPPSDAVLALERNGSYVLSLGTKDSSNTPLALALRFYGVPSPSAVGATRGPTFGHSPRTPLLQTTPLLYELNDETAEEAIFNFTRNISPASTVVKLLISRDWRMGVAVFRPSRLWREDGSVGTLVLFSLPSSRNSSRSQKVYQCANVRVGAEDASLMLRNLLWCVQGIPHKFDDQATGKLFDYILEFPGYLFLNDEDDGFRLTWAMDLWDIDGTCKSEITASPLTNGIDSVANIISSQETWEEFHSDKYTGRRLIPVENTPVPGVRVVSEAFLHVDVLLGAIIESKSFSESNPNFCYNLISVHHAGRTVDLIITFLRRQKPGSLGVFVRVDLFTGRYEEQDWVKSLCTKDASSLQAWCNTLALNRRMKQIRAGPYSIEAKHCIDWGRLSKESYFDCDEEDDFTPSVWREYVENQKNITTKKPPKFLSLSSLYPDCDLVTNKAITACLPVASLQCKKSPIQLVYG